MHKSREALPAISESKRSSVRGEYAGENAITINEMAPGTDQTAFLRSLSAKCCQVPHWGYLIEGSLIVGYTDGTVQTIKAGEVFYVPAGHDQSRTDDGCRYVEVSPGEGIKALLLEAGELAKR